MNVHKDALFTCLDDFAKSYEDWEHHNLIPNPRQRNRKGKLSLSEMLFIMVFFHLSGFRCFKLYYLYGVCRHYRNLFGDLPSYGRFVTLQPRLFMPLCLLLHHLSGETSGIYIADSTTLPVCHNRRINRNKTFEGLAARGRSSMGWFYGFKLHVIINDRGEIMALKITPGNIDDRVVMEAMTKGLKGKLFADKGYISKKLFAALRSRGLHLITGIRKTMKNYLMPIIDKLLLRRRFIVETVFDALKSQFGLVHTRHRSPTNAMVHIMSCVAAYQISPNKPKMNVSP